MSWMHCRFALLTFSLPKTEDDWHPLNSKSVLDSYHILVKKYMNMYMAYGLCSYMYQYTQPQSQGVHSEFDNFSARPSSIHIPHPPS